MSKIPGTECDLEFLVNCKTYPAVSTKYIETVCTGGVLPSGEFVRLYPIPFRFLDDEEKYKRWDIIRVKAYRDTKDKRPESWHLAPGCPIQLVQSVASDKQKWDWMKKTVHSSTDAMENKRITNGCVEIEPLELYWEAEEKEWTTTQLDVLNQGQLFLDAGAMSKISEKVPWQFRLKYRQKSSNQAGDGKVLAWSYYQGYLRNIGRGLTQLDALKAVHQKVSQSIFNPEKTVFAIFGTHSRFKTWMISSLYHVPTEVIKKRGDALF